MALTMEVFTAPTRNGIGVVWVVSSSGRSSREQTLQDSFERRIAPLLEHGSVIHASAPMFNLQDQVSDVRRAVRFVRHRAAEFGIDGQRPGINGSSAGGLLALVVAMQERDGDPAAEDIVERESSRVQAVGCFFPPTDLLNFGGPEANVPARLVVREGVGHAYPGWEADKALFADWFDAHLRRVR